VIQSTQSVRNIAGIGNVQPIRRSRQSNNGVTAQSVMLQKRTADAACRTYDQNICHAEQDSAEQLAFNAPRWLNPYFQSARRARQRTSLQKDSKNLLFI
jgi:acyl dehydratase